MCPKSRQAICGWIGEWRWLLRQVWVCQGCVNVATEEILIFCCCCFIEHCVRFCLGLWKPNPEKIPETTICLAHLAAYFGRSKSRQALQRNPWKSGLVVLQTSISCLLEKICWPVILKGDVESITSAQCSSKTPLLLIQTANFHKLLLFLIFPDQTNLWRNSALAAVLEDAKSWAPLLRITL